VGNRRNSREKGGEKLLRRKGFALEAPELVPYLETLITDVTHGVRTKGGGNRKINDSSNIGLQDRKGESIRSSISNERRAERDERGSLRKRAKEGAQQTKKKGSESLTVLLKKGVVVNKDLGV